MMHFELGFSYFKLIYLKYEAKRCEWQKFVAQFHDAIGERFMQR